MKLFVVTTMLLASLTAMADIEHTPGMEGVPSAAQLDRARTCFQEAEALGCGKPADDLLHFRSCVKNSRPQLTLECKSFLNNLFGTGL